MKKIESSGKNIETAISLGLAQLGLSREDVNIHIIDAGGMFKKAKVELEYDDGSKSTESFETLFNDSIKAETPRQEKKETIKVEHTDTTKIETHIAKPIFERVRKEFSLEPLPELEKTVNEFLDGLCKLNESTCEVVFKYTTEGLEVSLSGNNVGKIIGFRGEGLSSLQTLLNGLAFRIGADTFVILDIENYKVHREETLKELAKKNVSRALTNGRNISLDPMNAYERRIVHSVVSEMQGVTTESVGEGRNRHIIIKVN